MEALTVLVCCNTYVSLPRPRKKCAPKQNLSIPEVPPSPGPIRNSQSMAARAPEVVPCTKLRLFCTKVRDYSAPGPHVTKKAQTELAYIDILVNSKIRFDSVKRMTQIQNTS